MRRLCTFIGVSVFILMGLHASQGDEQTPGTLAGPQYTDEGKLLRPVGYQTWVFVGASLGMTYEEEPAAASEIGKFGNVYLDPRAYAQYVATGTFPEKTMLALAVYEPVSEASINTGGHFEGEQIALEVAVKDHEQFDEGWAYFDFQPGQKASQAFAKEKCYACHVQHAADDNVFVQFYPVLRGLNASKAHP